MRQIILNHKYPKLAKFFAGAIFLAFFLFGLYFTWQSYRLVKVGVVTSGVVVDIVQKMGSCSADNGIGGSCYVYSSVVEYVNTNGDKVKFTSNFGRPSPDAIGKNVKVVYDPKNIYSAEIYSFGAVWFLPVLLLAFSFLGFIFFIIAKKRKSTIVGISPQAKVAVSVEDENVKIVAMNTQAEKVAQQMRETADKYKDLLKKS